MTLTYRSDGTRSEVTLACVVPMPAPLDTGPFVDLPVTVFSPSEQPEPVAWRWRNKPDGVWNYQEARQRIETAEHQPLYAQPSEQTDKVDRMISGEIVPEAGSWDEGALLNHRAYSKQTGGGGEEARIDDEWRALFGDGPDSFANPGVIHYDEFKSAILAVLSTNEVAK